MALYNDIFTFCVFFLFNLQFKGKRKKKESIYELDDGSYVSFVMEKTSQLSNVQLKFIVLDYVLDDLGLCLEFE